MLRFVPTFMPYFVPIFIRFLLLQDKGKGKTAKTAAVDEDKNKVGLSRSFVPSFMSQFVPIFICFYLCCRTRGKERRLRQQRWKETRRQQQRQQWKRLRTK